MKVAALENLITGWSRCALNRMQYVLKASKLCENVKTDKKKKKTAGNNEQL